MRETGAALMATVALLLSGCDQLPGDDIGDDDPTFPTQLLGDDFSGGNLANWGVCGESQPVLDSSTGNPAPALRVIAVPGDYSEAISTQTFDVSGGLSIEWHMNPGGGGHTRRGGLSMNTGCNGPDADTLAAGYNIWNDRYLTVPLNAEMYLNGIKIATIDIDDRFGTGNPPGWLAVRLVILPSGKVRYYVNDSLVEESNSTLNLASPRPLTFQRVNDLYSEDLLIDNVFVRGP